MTKSKTKDGSYHIDNSDDIRKENEPKQQSRIVELATEMYGDADWTRLMPAYT